MGLQLIRAAGKPAVYTPPDGAPVPTVAELQRITRPRQDGMAIETVRLAYLPAVDVPAPQRGASLTIGAASYVVDALDDDDGSVVTVTVRPA